MRFVISERQRRHRFRLSTWLWCLLPGVILGCGRAQEPLIELDRTDQQTVEHEDDDSDKHVDPLMSTLPWSLLGKEIDGAACKSFVAASAEVPERQTLEDYGTFLNFRQSGLDLSSNLEHQIMTIIVYGPLSESYEPYRDPLPCSLKWTMSRKDVEERLGDPLQAAFYHSSINDQDQYSADYPALGLSLNYLASSDSDMNARLLDIRCKAPM